MPDLSYIAATKTAVVAGIAVGDRSAMLTSVWGKNESANTIYIQIVDAISMPANGAVSLVVAPLEVGAGDEFLFEPKEEIAFADGINIYGSSTQFTKTIVAVACLVMTIQYRARHINVTP